MSALILHPSSFILQPSANPFPGLRPFRSDEHHLFFGREDQTAALLQLLRENRFLAVVGTSGSGKSSLVRAGMIAELHGGTMTRAGSTWEVMILRPGGSPIENLARAFVEADLYDPNDPNTLPRLLATLNRSRFGLVEAIKQCDVFEPGTNLLVVVDQFEELFRFRQRGVDSEEAAAAFVNLLLTASQQAERPIYATITMRSDYLGDCSQVPGLAEAVNDGEYLIPRLGRDQKRDAIEKPIGVGGARISPLLVQRLLNDVGDDPDQLPVLQHALMRMWDVWSAEGDPERPIDFCDFDAIGGLEAALSNHADEIYDSLPDEEHRRACQRIFKTLTEKGADNRGIRRPTRLNRLAAIAGADRSTVMDVLEAYRRPGVTFLMPGEEQKLGDQTVVDLSHESLMRGWRRLRGWVEEEAQSARIFRRLADTAWLWREGKAGLFRNPDLQIAASWRDEEHPNDQWAGLYGGHFEEAIDFLQASEHAARAEIEAREAARQHELEQTRELAEARHQRLLQQQRATRKLHTMLVGLAAVALIAVTAFVAALVANNRATSLAALAKDAANKAEQNAHQAEQNAHEAEQAQQATAAALADVEREKNHAEKNLHKAVAAEEEAQKAEERSREFRYATDVQLAARLVGDDDANATQIHARLADHDPAENKELAGKEDLRGFEWHYLNRLVEGRAAVMQGFDKDLVAAALNPEGELVTLDGDARLQHWNLDTRQETRPALNLQKGRGVTAQTLSSDGRRAALAIGDQVHLVNAMTGEENARTIPAQTRGGLVFAPSGQVLITVDTGLGWWDAATARPIARQEFQLPLSQGHWPISVSADGLTAVVGGQGNYRDSFSVFTMNPESREITRLLDKIGDRTGTKRTLAISPDGKTIAVSHFFQGAVDFYDAATGKPSRSRHSAHTASISAIAFSPDGALLVTAAMDGSVKVWNDHQRLETAKPRALVGHAKEVAAASFVAAGKQVLTAGKDKTVRLWNLEQSASSLQQTIAGAGGFRGRFSPDGTLMAVSGDKHLQLRDGKTGEVVAQLPERGDEISSDSVAFSPDNRLLAAGFGGKKDVSDIELWDIDRRERLAVMPAATTIPGFITDEYHGLVTALAFSPDGKQLVAGFGSLNMLGGGDQGDHPLLVYDIAAQRVVRRLRGQRNDCIAVSFSQDGSRLASASYDGTARIWDAATWQELHVLENPDTASDRGQRRVHDVAFSPDGKLLAMASAEGNVIIWSADTGEQLQTLVGHANEVWCVAFAPGGRTLASGSTDGTIRLWNTATWRELVHLDPEASFDPRSLAFSTDGSRLLAASFRGEAMMWSVLRAGDQAGPTAEQLAALLPAGRAPAQTEDGLPRPSGNLGWDKRVERAPTHRADHGGPALASSLVPPYHFASRVRMLSENLRLPEALEKLSNERADDAAVQSALAAARANGYASRQEWKSAVEQFDLLEQLATPTQSVSDEDAPTQSVSDEKGSNDDDRPGSSLTLRVGVQSPNSPDTWLRTPGLIRLATALLHEGRPAEAAVLLTGGEKRRAADGNGSRAVAFGFRYAPAEYPFKLLHVFRGSPAWRAGLRAGDRLLKFNDVEVAAENLAKLVELSQGETTIRFTVQCAGQDQPDTIELTKASHIQDDATNQLIEGLLTAVNEKLAATPDDAGLLELRAELFGQSSDYEPQAADYTAAIQAISGSGIHENPGEHSAIPEDSDKPVAELARVPGLDLQSLHRRRGNAYVGLKQWQRALDDYTNGISNEISDEGLLDNHALAQANVLLPELPEAFVRVGQEDQPHGIRLMDYSDDGTTKPTAVSGAECRFIDTTRGYGHAYLAIDDDFKPALSKGAVMEVEYCDKGAGTFQVQYDSQDNAYRGAEAIGLTNSNEWKTARLVLMDVWFANRQNGKSDFRIMQVGTPLYFRRVTIRPWLPGMESDNPWVRLAAAYRLEGDQQSIDQLVERHPRSAGLIGDLFTQGEKADWRRAIEIYSKGAVRRAPVGREFQPDNHQAGKPDLLDAELLAKRASAYEHLRDWAAAATDWQRAAGENPDGARLLAEFANRLVQPDERRLALAARERAKKVLEAALEANPGDEPAAESLAAVLLDMSNPDEWKWTALKPAKLKTAGGATLALKEDASVVVELGPYTITLADADDSPAALRIETSPDTTFPAEGAPFTEYQVVSTRLPADGFFGRYVHIDLPGENAQFARADGNQKMLNLAELQVFQGQRNIAIGKTARQSSTYRDDNGDGEAERAVDGNTDAKLGDRWSLAHTSPSTDPSDPWWEVDLGAEQAFDRVVVWNRPGLITRMNHFRVRILDDARKIVFEQVIDQAPNPSREIGRQTQLTKPDVAEGGGPWRLSFDPARQPQPWQRLRISLTDDHPVLAADAIESSEVKWTLADPTKLTLANAPKLTARTDGSFLFEPEADSIALAEIPDSAKAIRVETATMSEPDQAKSRRFNGHRAQALVAPDSGAGAFRGQYVRIDLPGDNKRFPRLESDGDRKVLSMAEVQIFQGGENVARSGHARQSTTRYGLEPQRALDGNTNGTWGASSLTHTDESDRDPWWEVDLGSPRTIDRIVVWNRTDWGQLRLSHFRVRILDASRQVVFEQVIDPTPNPSREIVCRSFLVEQPSSVAQAGGTPTPQDTPPWALRLGQEVGIAVNQRFRVSVAASLIDIESEEKRLEAMNITDSTTRLAAAYALNGIPEHATQWFDKALAAAMTRQERKSATERLEGFSEVLAALLKLRPDDAQLQLMLARSDARRGREELERKHPAEALAALAQARDRLTELNDRYPEPHWTVLKPVELKSHGGATLTLQDDGSILASGTNPERDQYTLVAKTDLNRITAIRLEALPDPALPNNGPGRSGFGTFRLNELRVYSSGKHVALIDIVTDYDEQKKARNTIDGRLDALYWGNYPRGGQRDTAYIAAALALTPADELKFEMNFSLGPWTQHNLGCFRLSVTGDPNPLVNDPLLLDRKPDELADLDVAIAKVQAQQGQVNEAAAALEAAFDGIEKREDQKKFINQLKGLDDALVELAKLRPQHAELQLALAQPHAERGRELLANERTAEALVELEQAQAIVTRLLAEHPEPTWTVLHPVEMKSQGGAILTRQADGSILASGENPLQDIYTLTFSDLPATIRGLRLEVLPHPSLPHDGPGRASNGNLVLTEIFVKLKRAPSGPDQFLRLKSAAATHEQSNFTIAAAIDNDDKSTTAGWALVPKVGEAHHAVFELEGDAAAGPGSTLTISLVQNHIGHVIGRCRVSVTSDSHAVQAMQLRRDLAASGFADLEISLGNAYAQNGEFDQAAATLDRALDRADERVEVENIIRAASTHAGVLAQLSERKASDARYRDILARHYANRGDLKHTPEAVARARAMYEAQLASNPENLQLAKALADLLIECFPVLQVVGMRSQGGATLTLQDDGSILVSGVNPDRDAYTLLAKTDLEHITAIRLEALTHPSLPSQGPGRSGNGNFHLNELRVFSAGAPVALQNIVVAYEERPGAQNVIDGKIDPVMGWGNFPRAGQPNAALIAMQLDRAPGDDLKIEMYFSRAEWTQHNLGRFRLSVTDDPQAFAREEYRFAALQVSDPWPRLGAAYYYIGDEARSLDAFSRALKMASDDKAKAEVARLAAPFEKVFAALLERAPDSPFLRLGQAKYLAPKRIADHRFQEALAVASQALETFPDDLDLLTGRAEAQMKLRHWSAAIDNYSRVIERSTDDGTRRAAELARAEARLRLGQSAEAAELFTQQMFLSPSWEGPRDALAAQLLAGNVPAAKAAATRLFQTVPSDSKDAYWCNLMVSDFIALPGMITQANQARLTSAAEAAGGEWTRPFKAAIQYRLGKLNEAAPLVSDAPGHPHFLSLAAMLLYDKGETDLARQYLERADDWFRKQRDRDPDATVPGSQFWQDWAVRLAVWHEATRKLAGPRLAELDAQLRAEPANVAYLLERARLLSAIGLDEEALADFSKVPQPTASSSDYSGLRGRILAGLNRSDEALTDLNQAIEAQSTDPRVYAARATILRKQGAIEQARSDLEKSLALEPTEPAAQLMADLLLADATRWTVLTPTEMMSQAGATLTPEPDGSVLASGPNPATDRYEIRLSVTPQPMTALKLDALVDPSLPNYGPGRVGYFIVSEIEAYQRLSGQEWKRIDWDGAVASFEQVGYAATAAVDNQLGPSGWAIWAPDGGGIGLDQSLIARLREPIAPGEIELRFVIHQNLDNPNYPGHNLGRFRLSVTDDATAFDRQRQRFAALKLTDPWQKLAAAYRLVGDERAVDRLLTSQPRRLALRGQMTQAVEAYAKALADAQDETARSQIMDELAQFDDILTAIQILNGDWTSAAASYTRQVEQNLNADSLAWMAAPTLWAYVGNAKRHRESCQKMYERFRGSTAAADHERCLKTMLALENGPELPADSLEKLYASSDSLDREIRAWFLVTQAWLDCRQGNHAEARQRVDEALALAKELKLSHADIKALALAVRALSYATQKDEVHARETLDELKRVMSEEQKITWKADGLIDGSTILSGVTVQHDKLNTELLRREAAGLIDAAPSGLRVNDSGPAVKKRKPR